MVASAETAAPLAVVEVPIKRIKVSTRLRGTDEDKVTDLAESIEGPLYQQRSPLVSKKPGGATDEQ